MFFSSKLLDFFTRLVLGMVVGMFLGWAISETSYLFLPKQNLDRAPQQINLVIPEGTARKIETGEYTSVLPSGTEFVEGDVLVVKNEDAVAHQLGPLFIPPNTSSKLSLDTANTYTYTCSFQTNQYVGLVVQPRVTFGTRMEGLLAIGLPTGMILMVYSYLVPVSSLPWKKKKAAAEKDKSTSHNPTTTGSADSPLAEGK